MADAHSASPLVNQAVAFGPLDVELAAEVAAAVPSERGFGLFSPLPTPDLAGAGLEPVGHPPLMLRPAGGDGPAPPPGVDVEDVAGADGLARWGRLVAETFPAPASTRRPACLRPGAARPAGRRLRRARRRRRRVGGHPARLPRPGRGRSRHVGGDHRRSRPAGRALASDLGRPVYERLGYLPLVRWTMWCRRPSGVG